MKKIITLMLAAFSFAPWCSATEQERTGASDAPVAVEVFFIPNGLSFGVHINEAILQQIGCTYIIEDLATSSTLLKLISDARDYPQSSVDMKEKFETRNKLVFHFQNRKDVSVTFSQKYSNQTYIDANWNSEPIHLNGNVIEKIRSLLKEKRIEQINKNASKNCSAI
ncbi:hypothetical protein [Duganella qianjiadongensis]|uniref:DUF3016 domain-containing protein n=1 Tax=Duganella qianjiadongensis TaxID=2692176 RepID=A0ABW9VHF4_9BURK|nr:hypothetical protein [Duganella qianjiadongensis]MYM38003.1 hypothetical protein [Duganella qianjiadongensis]